jgi:hypothetical protein
MSKSIRKRGAAVVVKNLLPPCHGSKRAGYIVDSRAVGIVVDLAHPNPGRKRGQNCRGLHISLALRVTMPAEEFMITVVGGGGEADLPPRVMPAAKAVMKSRRFNHRVRCGPASCRPP